MELSFLDHGFNYKLHINFFHLLICHDKRCASAWSLCWCDRFANDSEKRLIRYQITLNEIRATNSQHHEHGMETKIKQLTTNVTHTLAHKNDVKYMDE